MLYNDCFNRVFDCYIREHCTSLRSAVINNLQNNYMLALCKDWRKHIDNYTIIHRTAKTEQSSLQWVTLIEQSGSHVIL